MVAVLASDMAWIGSVDSANQEPAARSSPAPRPPASTSPTLAKLGVSGGGRRRSRRTTSDWSRSELTGPRTLVGVNWKVAIALGAAVGGVVYAVLRKNRTAAADAELWAEATDPL